MPDPISTALTAWATKRLADSAAASVRRRKLRRADAPEVRKALITAVKDGVSQAVDEVFPPANQKARNHVRDMLLERPDREWPLVDGTYLVDLPAVVQEWVSWIESPPNGDGEIEPVETEHPLVLQLCMDILERIRHDATRGTRVLTELWLDFRAETGIPADTAKPAMQTTAPPFELCFQPRYWTDRTALIERIVRRLRTPDRCPVLITGPVGSGKTTLAGVVGAMLKNQFTDGILHLEPKPDRHEEEMYSALERIGGTVLPSKPAHIERMYRSVLSSRKMIVVLDEPSGRTTIERFWPRSGDTAYIVLTSKAIRWREAETVALPPLNPEDSTALLEATEAISPEDVKKVITLFGCVPGRLLDAAGIVVAGKISADDLADLVAAHDQADLLLRRLNSVSVSAQEMYRNLCRLPNPLIEQSLLDHLEKQPEYDSPSSELKEAHLMVEAGPALWRLRLQSDRSSNGDGHV